MANKEELIRVFFDTYDWCRSTEKLRRSIKKSQGKTMIYRPETELELPQRKREAAGTVTVTEERSFEAAMRLHRQYPQDKIAVLNFASATHPGGGVRAGSSAQEESLCRCSTLYPLLNTQELKEGFYQIHKDSGDCRYSDTCIYTPNVVICKTDAILPERLPEGDWVMTDVLTCAAPNLNRVYQPGRNPDTAESLQISSEELYEIHISRARRILTVAALHEIDCFVSGAFGCGAFRNDPAIVAGAWKKVLPEFDGYFRELVFAVYCGRQKNNFLTFREILGKGRECC